jgi:hypothetical protein
MAARIDILSPFTQIQPGPFISKFQDWIIFTLLLFFFWAVVGIALKKKFGESRHLRVLVTSVSLMLAVGTYYSIYQGGLHVNLQGFGLFGAILLFAIIFFIIFGLMKGHGMHVSNALPLGFALFYISLWAVSPNILHTIQNVFPPVNGILLILFIVSIFKIIFAFFNYSKEFPFGTVIDLSKTQFMKNENFATNRKTLENKKESKPLKKNTIKLTSQSLKTVEDIEGCLKQSIAIIKEKGNTIDRQETDQLINILRQIGKKEDLLKKSVGLIKVHVNAYEAIHRKDIPELEKRLNQTHDKKQRKTIEQEVIYQKRMLQVLDFMQKYENKINEFIRSFDNLLSAAMQRLKSHYPKDALSYLENANASLENMKHIYNKQQDYEKYLLTLNKKTIRDLKKEKGQ